MLQPVDESIDDLDDFVHRNENIISADLNLVENSDGTCSNSRASGFKIRRAVAATHEHEEATKTKIKPKPSSEMKIQRDGESKDDFNVCHSIRYEAWKVAFGDIYTPTEIEAYFYGDVEDNRTWLSLNCNRQETFVCELKGEIVGYAKWSWHSGSGSDESVRGTNGNYNNGIEIAVAKEEEEPLEEPKSSQLSSDTDRNHHHGELNSLYVSPKYWNNGVGGLLWDVVLHQCHRWNVTMLDIWVLERARSGEFYLSRGCKCVSKGDFYVGDHMETALCYRWERL